MKFILILTKYPKFRIISNLVEAIKTQKVLEKNNKLTLNQIKGEIMGILVAMENAFNKLKEQKVRMVMKAKESMLRSCKTE